MDLFRSTYLPMAVDLAVIQENDRAVEEQMASLLLYDLSAGLPNPSGGAGLREGSTALAARCLNSVRPVGRDNDGG